jgi:hypothetical protein
MISMSRPPINPRIAPSGIIAMITAGRRLLVAGEFDGVLVVAMRVELLCRLLLDEIPGDQP